MRIGIDLMGGDYAPQEVVKGVCDILHQSPANLRLCLIGEKARVQPLLQEFGISYNPKVEFVPSGQSITYQDSPAKILKEKKNSSIILGFQLLETNQIDSFISAGNTGALLVGAHTIIKPIENIIRPAIGVAIPLANNQTTLLLDVGSNIECKPEQLNQFAILATIYAETIGQISNPSVALMNVGEESNKGNTLYIKAYKLLTENKNINFIGNIEGGDILKNKTDIIVCDGFTGNIIIKYTESLYTLLDLKSQEDKKPHYKLFNFEEHGGVPILGIRKPVIVGHGISTAKAFTNMIGLSINLVETQFCKKIESALIKSRSS